MVGNFFANVCCVLLRSLCKWRTLTFRELLTVLYIIILITVLITETAHESAQWATCVSYYDSTFTPHETQKRVSIKITTHCSSSYTRMSISGHRSGRCKQFQSNRNSYWTMNVGSRKNHLTSESCGGATVVVCPPRPHVPPARSAAPLPRRLWRCSFRWQQTVLWPFRVLIADGDVRSEIILFATRYRREHHNYANAVKCSMQHGKKPQHALSKLEPN